MGCTGSVGLAKFSPPFTQLLMDRSGTLLEDGHQQAYDTLAFTRRAHEGHALGIEAFTGRTWTEIDMPEDLESARRMFPAGG